MRIKKTAVDGLRPLSSIIIRLFFVVVIPWTVVAASVWGQERKETDAILPPPLTMLASTGLSTSAHLADDLRSFFSSSGEFRLFPLIGNGDFADASDLMSRDFIDLALVQADVLHYLLESEKEASINKRANYIMTIYNADVHLLVSSDIISVEMLDGRKVNFGPNLDGTYLTASELFANRNVDVIATTFPHQKAYPLLQAGEIDAMVIVDGKPSKLLAAASLDDGVRLIPVSGADLSDIYVASTISSEDYPDLFAGGDEVATIGVPTVLIAYVWPDGSRRVKTLNRFTEALLSGLSDLRMPNKGFHPKWREADAWKRMPNQWRRDPHVLKLINPMNRFREDN